MPILSRRLILVTFAFLLSALTGVSRETIDLNGTWSFAIDPLRQGEQHGWHKAAQNIKDWTEVDVPHCWSVDVRFQYTGAAWYRRSFTLPSTAVGQHVRLVFQGVFYRTRVWVNGQILGTHEGGYTRFSFDATKLVNPQGQNTVALEVDNSWSTETLPGARVGTRPSDQVYPWWNYGGITRPVSIEITSPVYVASQQVVATPDLVAKSARLQVTTMVANTHDQPLRARVGFDVAPSKRPTSEVWPASAAAFSSEVIIQPGSVAQVKAEYTLPPEHVKLWDQDHPNLYVMHTRIWDLEGVAPALLDDADTAVFGIRKLEIKDARLLLNGEPIRMGGANRHIDHPKFGSIDPPSVIDADLSQMKRANMEFSRISHYPVSEALLEWADRNGHLIIAEGPNWQLTEEQMDSALIRAKFQAQTREMIEQDWNHPSVVAWSVGNEYPSFSPAGLRWTKDMIAWVRTVDASRLVTFASDKARSDKFEKPDGEGSYYSDFVCANLYEPGHVEQYLDRIHARWPEKPIFVSEFGTLADGAASDEDRQRYFLRMITAFRGRPYVIGASIWTFADYRSRYPGGTNTATDGFRHFGAVSADREPRGVYRLLKDEFSPVVVSQERASSDPSVIVASALVGVRPDFPSYTLRDYSVRGLLLNQAGATIATKTIPLSVLRPGASQAIEFRFEQPRDRRPVGLRIEIVRPNGFIMRTTNVALTSL